MSTEPNKGGSPCACCPCTCSACNSCLKRLCEACCPYLSSKDRYAGVEYLPIEPVEPLHESLMSARQSLQTTPIQHFPHKCDPADVIQEEDEYDYEEHVITEEPKSMYERVMQTTASHTKSSHQATSVSESASTSEYEYNSEDDLGVELGFVDYEHTDKPEDRNVRICRTPDPSFEADELDSEGYQLAIRSQSDERPKRSLSEERMKRSDVAYTRGRSQLVEPESSPHKPGVQFSLYFDEKSNVLIVHVLRGYNLPTKRDESASNPFAEVYLLPNKAEVHETRTMYQTLNPIFDQAFKFSGLTADEVRKQMLVMRVYLHGKHHFIGGIMFPLEKANLFGSSQYKDFTAFDEESGLKDSCKGDILLSMTHYPEAGTLEVLVLEANNLKKQDLIGLPNPYMKVNMILEGNRISKWKTGAQKNTLNPVFNELCELDIATMNTDDLEVEVVVTDYDRFGRNSELGSVVFGSNVANESGKSHWKEVVNNPSVSHMCWHVLTIPEGMFGRLMPRSPMRARRSRSPVSCVSSAGK